MDYEHDVFISYRREQDGWTPWTRDHFKKLLKIYLQQDLGRPPSIFVDERIEPGMDWVDALAENLATSKVVVAVFSGDYFGSQWCVHELDLILERSSACAAGGKNDPRLIVPVVVHDGELIPDPVTRIQPADFSRFRVAFLTETAPLYQDFSMAMRVLSPKVKAAIDLTPPFDAGWIDHHRKRFNDVYAAVIAKTPLPPTQFALKSPTPPTAPPRLVL
jgi:hypothetical protein